MVSYLLEHGVDVNYAKKDGFTSLMIVSQKGHLEVVSYLVEHNARVNDASEVECTARFCLCVPGFVFTFTSAFALMCYWYCDC